MITDGKYGTAANVLYVHYWDRYLLLRIHPIRSLHRVTEVGTNLETRAHRPDQTGDHRGRSRWSSWGRWWSPGSGRDVWDSLNLLRTTKLDFCTDHPVHRFHLLDGDDATHQRDALSDGRFIVNVLDDLASSAHEQVRTHTSSIFPVCVAVSLIIIGLNLSSTGGEVKYDY